MKVPKLLTVAASGMLLTMTLPTVSFAATKNQSVQQGVGSSVLQNADYFGNTAPSTPVTVDIVLKVQNEAQLQHFITESVTPQSRDYRNYLTVSQFRQKYTPSADATQAIISYLAQFGIQSQVYSDGLVITATGTAGDFNKAFSITLQNAKFQGKRFHATKQAPRVPGLLAKDILCVLGLTDYSDLKSLSIKRPDSTTNSPTGPLNLKPQDLIKRYDVAPLYREGATGAGETIGIVSLAGLNVQDPYTFWNDMGVKVKPNRLSVINVDGFSPSDSSYYDGYDETTLDVEQSGALAPQADIKVYVGSNSDTGFVDAYARALSDNQIQTLSVSWGESEGAIQYFVDEQEETPAYADVFNELYMEAAAQGISNFAAAGDSGAYDTSEFAGYGIPGTYSLAVDNPADSPYITAAGGTTLPWHATFTTNPTTKEPLPSAVSVNVTQERAWSWDYLYPYFDARGFDNLDGWNSRYFVGGGGGFSQYFATPAYQRGVPGVNQYTGVLQWNISSDGNQLNGHLSPVQTVSGTGSGRNVPDVSMDADPYTGYLVYLSDAGAPGENGSFQTYGGTSFVAPQLNGLTALMDSADHTQIGFWNPQIYTFALQKNSPFTPLNTTGTDNDNLFYTGTPGTVYNQATGLGVPDIAKLSQDFVAGHKNPSHHG